MRFSSKNLAFSFPHCRLNACRDVEYKVNSPMTSGLSAPFYKMLNALQALESLLTVNFLL